jgi:transcriptional regulator with XRE-family HTH domain
MNGEHLKESVALPRWVKSELVYHGLSVKGLARRYKVSPATIAKILSGKARFERRRKAHELLKAIASDYPVLLPVLKKLYPSEF